MDDYNESRNSDIKKNAAPIFNDNTKNKVNNINESKMLSDQKIDAMQPLQSEVKDDNNQKPVEMKINLQRAERKDSNGIQSSGISPTKEEMPANLHESKPPITKEKPIESHPEEMRVDKPTSVMDEEAKQQHLPQDELSILSNKLLDFDKKTDYILDHLGNWIYTSQYPSLTRKILKIKELWGKISKENKKVLKILMKNQFNIDLNYFDLDIDDSQKYSAPQKIQLQYVKPAIVESLYQEIDMLYWWLKLKNICNQSPVIPVDRDVDLFVSQFAPRIGNPDRNERSANPEVRMDSSYNSNETSYARMKASSNFYGAQEAENHDSSSRKYYSSQNIRTNVADKYNGMNAGLNYTSGQLNRDNHRYNEQQYLSNQDKRMVDKNSSKYMPQGMDGQMSQYPKHFDMYTDSRYNNRIGQMSRQNSMQGYPNINDYSNNVLM